VVSNFIIFISYVFFVLHNKSNLQFYQKRKKKRSECFFDGMLQKVSLEFDCPPIMFRSVLWVKGDFAYRVVAKILDMWFEVFECFLTSL